MREGAAVSAPGWVAASRKRIFFDMHLPSWPGMGIAESFDPEVLSGAIIGSGADSAVIYGKCQFGNFYTRVPGEALHPGLGEMDLLEEVSSRLRAGGVKTIVYYSVSWDERFADEHPEWLTETADGARGKGSTRWRTLCINGPYADVVERHLVEIARKPVDGIWLDMTIIGEGHCYCLRCRSKFLAEHGRQPPASPAEPGYAEFLAFRYDIVESFYRRIRGVLRSAAPQVAFTNNYWGYPWTPSEMGSRALGATAEVDFLTGEAYSDWTGIRSTSMLPIFLRSAAAGRPFEALIGTMVSTWDFTRKPRAYLAYEAFSIFAHGGTVTVDDEPLHSGQFDASLYSDDLREIFGDITRLSRTIEGRHARWVSVYHSQRAKDRCRDQREFVRDVSGAFRLFRDLGLAVDFTFDEARAVLDPREVPVLALSGATELTGDEWERIREYAEGGGLVVSAGGIGGDGAVAAGLDRLGIAAAGASEYSISYLRVPGANRDLLVRGRYAVLSASGEHGDTRGEVVDPLCETTPTRFFHNNLPSPYRVSGTPGMIEIPVGRGALLIFPQPLFRHYAKEPSRELRGLVREVLVRRCPPPPLELRVPLRMDHAIVESGGVTWVHLLNPSVEPALCCGLMDTHDGGFERSYEYMEEEVPVHDLRILVRQPRVTRVRTLREGSPVRKRRTAEGWEITVDRVALWEVVEIQGG
jgi:hypothetical protein